MRFQRRIMIILLWAVGSVLGLGVSGASAYQEVPVVEGGGVKGQGPFKGGKTRPAGP